MSKKKQHKPKIHYGKAVANSSKPTVSNNAVNTPMLKPVDMSGQVTLCFNATDTLFFRESRPMESMGELQSVFPPPVRTLAGAIRTLIGEQRGVDWRKFDAGHSAVADIGFGDDLGKLHFQGAWLAWKGQRLYPAPLTLMQKEGKVVGALQLETKGIWCDLGKNVRLPKLPKGIEAGCKPLENTWLTAAGLSAVLQGHLPKADDIKKASDLFERESRLGIARDNATRTVEKGLLYQTQHIRPHQDLTVELDASGLPDDMPIKAMVRLGGEGRTASLNIKSVEQTLPQAPAVKNAQGLLLYLLTPLSILPTGKEWQPLPSFTREEREQQTVWTGSLNGIELELHGAVTGKALREGGWDMAQHQPRAVTSLIPAGSVFFCTAKDGNTQAAIQALHNTQIGERSAYGYGHLAAGLWLKD